MSLARQFRFSGGEVAPALWGGCDLAKYQSALRTMRNFFTARSGGAWNRPGTTFCAEVGDSTKTVRLIRFVFNASQTYVLEFGDQYVRFFKAGALLTEATVAVSAITASNPAQVLTATNHGYSTGDEVTFLGVSAMTQVNGRNFRVGAVIDATTFQLLNKDGTNFNATGFSLGTGGTVARVYQVATPYSYLDLAGIRFTQSGDVLTLAHPGYAPRQLTRNGDTSWAFSTITFSPTIAAPVLTAPNTGTATDYVVTAVSATGEESVASNELGTSVTSPSGASLVTVSWNAVVGAVSYNVYRRNNTSSSTAYTAGRMCYVGSTNAGITTYFDDGHAATFTQTPPVDRALFGSANNYPTAVAYFQQRLALGGWNNGPESVAASKIGFFTNFTFETPLISSDSLLFTFASREVNAIKHLLDLGRPLVLTAAGEWSLDGDSAGSLVPTAINPRQHSSYGSADLTPLVVGASALFVQARASIIRDLSFDIAVNGYRGNDLTIFASHLFDKYTIVDWTYAQIPHSIVWVVRSDGTLLGMTYIREQQVFAWHHHDTAGAFEGVCSVPEGNEDAVYVVVRRTINGATKRYVERFSTRQVNDIRDSNFTDCSLVYDGRNTNTSATVTLSGGVNWDYTETLTLTCAVSVFSVSDVGKTMQVFDSAGNEIRLLVTQAVSGTVVRGKPDITVPTTLRGVATATWVRAVTSVTGLWQLEGQQVAVFADGYVVASPNNSDYAVLTVTGGSLTFTRPYGVIRVGLPYLSDLEALDIDSPQAESTVNKKQLITKLHLRLESSRGVFAGPRPPTNDLLNPKEGLQELKIRNTESLGQPVALATETLSIDLTSEWTRGGRVFVRQVDPLPLAINEIAPDGFIPVRGG